MYHFCERSQTSHLHISVILMVHLKIVRIWNWGRAVRLGYWSAPVGAIAGTGERVLTAKGRVRTLVTIADDEGVRQQGSAVRIGQTGQSHG